jgi:Zn-dependent protease with chaperone function
VFGGKLYDGITGHPHVVRVEVDADGLSLRQDGGWSDQVARSVLTRLDSDGEQLRLGRTDRPGWRLLIAGQSERELEPLLGGRRERYGRWIDRVGLMPALAIGGLLTAATLAFGYAAPSWIAPHVPMSWERNVGGAMVGDFGNLRCRSAKGQQALEILAERVAPGATKGPEAIKIAALDLPVFNAAALPGGYIVVFKPAITETDSDALAGVVAHEIAHVRRRHVTEALIRELGIGALIRLFAGDIGANAEQLVALDYTRANEAEADADAIVMLRRANISPKPTAALFDRLAKEQHERLASSAEFLQSHPLSRGRAQRFAASFESQTAYRPALDRNQASALQSICSSPPVKAT